MTPFTELIYNSFSNHTSLIPLEGIYRTDFNKCN